MLFHMEEIASISIGTCSLLKERSAFFRFVSKIDVFVPSKFMRTMGKLALVVVRAVAFFHELAT